MKKLFWYLLIILTPLGVRTLISASAPFSEYNSVFLYASDIALFLFVSFSLPSIVQGIRSLPGRTAMLVFVLCAIVSVFVSSATLVGLVAAVRLVLLIAAAIVAGKLLKESSVLTVTLVLISLLALFQGTVAILQFTGQGPVGLKMLGESPISIADPGTAKVTVEGAKLLRAYGTMPDPNILAGFLLVGLCALAYLFLRADKGLYIDAFDKTRSISVNFQRYLMSRLLYGRVVAATAMFIVSMGLVFTFSRSGWFATAIAMMVMLCLATRQSARAAGRFLALLLIISGALYYFFSPLILARAGLSADEPSVSYRVEYARIGSEQLVEHWLTGVGIAGGVVEANQQGRYAAHGMINGWERQPVHNVYLLIASEIGALGALAFCFFLVIVVKRLVADKSLEATLALAGLMGLMTFALFDHFLWDIQAGRMMLWLVIALALSTTIDE